MDNKKPEITKEQIKQRAREIFETAGIEIPKNFTLMMTGVPDLNQYVSKLGIHKGTYIKFLTDIKNSIVL